ncbi:HAD domain-containing protein [Roseateles sp. BYS87W]|uniref:HAD domain-containing protein n=1 Tax=Pelomonas baiyunensis TaxID=3299026 RepID=A0ABW7H2K1_9BURK
MNTQQPSPLHGAARRTRRFDPTLPPLVFLDFDGVLHPNQTTPDQRFEHVDVLMDLLDEHPEAELVVSSSWRFHFGWDDLLAEVPSRLAKRLVTATGPALPGRFQRHAEIKNFLGRLEVDGQGVRPWRALDDCAWEFPSNCTELIACDGARGVQEGELYELQEWLSQLSSCRLAIDTGGAPASPELARRAVEVLDAADIPNVALLQRTFRLSYSEALHMLGAYLHHTR